MHRHNFNQPSTAEQSHEHPGHHGHHGPHARAENPAGSPGQWQHFAAGFRGFGPGPGRGPSHSRHGRGPGFGFGHAHGWHFRPGQTGENSGFRRGWRGGFGPASQAEAIARLEQFEQHLARRLEWVRQKLAELRSQPAGGSSGTGSSFNSAGSSDVDANML